ncbi:MAG: transporter substrate-binding domain-containing protein [Candidatus Heimdallarchaeota archaeon]|nr:transporter substrate-binding domain-containing protein [Candidatus Heimdallarchaeota archaeon]
MKIKISLLLMAILTLATLANAEVITITTIDDANVEGLKIGVQSGTTSDLYAQDNLNKSTLMAYDSILLAEQAFEAGDVHVVLGDKPVLDAWIADMDEYKVLDTFSEELFGLGVKEGEDDLLDALNAALTEIFQDTGAHGYDAIYAETFDDLPAVYDDGDGNYAYPAIGDLDTAGRLKAIIDAGTIEFGTDPTYPPFEEKLTDGTYEGFDIDMMDEIALRLSAEYDTTITVTIVDSDWDPIIPNLKAGEFDVILSAMTKTPERDAEIDFTRAYYGSIQAIVGPADGKIDLGDDDAGFLPIPIAPIFAALAVIPLIRRKR